MGLPPPGHSIQAVIFDLGSTLIYFDGDWPSVAPQATNSLLEALRSTGVSLDEAAFAAQFEERLDAYYVERDTEFIEHTTAYVLNTLLDDWGIPSLTEPELRSVLRALYAVSQAYWKVEMDAHSTLQTLQAQGYKLGMISNAGDDEDVQTLVDKSGLRPYFAEIVTSAAAGIRKPNPRLFTDMARRLQVAPANTAVIGDRLGADVLGAHNAGMYGILITRRAETAGNRAHAGTIHPDAVIETLAELPEALRRLA